jgi:hypothetical protein
MGRIHQRPAVEVGVAVVEARLFMLTGALSGVKRQFEGDPIGTRASPAQVLTRLSRNQPLARRLQSLKNVDI